jgi:hypothetical protein
MPPVWLVICAVPAVVCAWKVVTPPLLLSIVAFAAVAVSVPPGVPKNVAPPLVLVIAIELAEVAFMNMVNALENVPSLAIEVMPDVLALTMKNCPSLVTSPTMDAVWVASPSCNVAQLQMVVPPE